MTKSMSILSKYRTNISEYLKNFLNQEKKELKEISLDDNVFKTLKNFVVRGKMARANLFILTYKILEPQKEKEIFEKVLLPLAGALELIQAGLLIHDDIIDQDQQRRGQDSIWQYYSKQSQNTDQHYGKNQAICLGNLCFFLANQLILEAVNNLGSQLNEKQLLQVQQLINREISQVILAEMLDSQLAMQKTLPSLEKILEMNIYKTARYSFSLPLMLAGKLTNRSEDTNQLSEIGEKIGLIFQIRDDYLGIFGDSEKTGKPILSDIKEGKKTIFYYYLVQNKALTDQEKHLLNNCFAKKNIKQSQSLAIQKLFKNHSLKQVNQFLNKLNQETQIMINELKNKKMQELLLQILNFACCRHN
jgi:geranylgeranyl diphosphate synthase, type I